MFINFWNFFQGLQSYYGLKGLKFYYISLHILRGYVYSFCQIFQRLCLFKGLRLFRTLEYGVGEMFNEWEKKYDKYLEVKQWRHGEGAVKKSGRTGYVIYGWTPQNRRHLWKTPKILRLWSWRRYLLSSPDPRSIDRIKFNVSIGFVIATPKVLVENYRSIIFRKSPFFSNGTRVFP